MTHGVFQTISRREALKTIGSTSVATSLAGCNTLSGGPTGEMEISYWDVLHLESDRSKSAIKDFVSRFEDEYGTDVELNLSSGVTSQSWKLGFRENSYPVVYDASSAFMGPYIGNGYIKPVSEYRSELDSEALSQIEWILPAMKQGYRGYREDLYEIPIGAIPQVPFMANMDHFEQAGLDPAADFPPENYEHLLQIASTLQEDGPGDIGYQIFGQAFDISDSVIPTWTVAQAGEDGLYLNDDWTDTVVDSDPWIENTRKYVDLYREHGLSGQDTVSASGEGTVPDLANGKVSMTSPEWQDLPILLEQAPDMMESGTLRWGPSWKGESGYRGHLIIQTVGITRPQPDADEEEYRQKQQAAYDLINFWLSKDVQKTIHENYGQLPVRRDVWEEIPTKPHNGFETVKQIATDGNLSWAAHPKTLSIVFEIIPPYLQKALQGKISAEEACTRAANEIRGVL